MRAAIVGGAWTMYQYDGNGQRIAKWNVNGTDITIHGPGGLPVRPRGEFGSSIAIVQAELGARRVDCGRLANQKTA